MMGTDTSTLARTADWRDYYELTKPRVVMLIVFTAIVGMFLAVPGWPGLSALLFGTLGIGLAASSAAVVNHVLDARIDREMSRTRGRPLPQGRLSEAHALLFALVLCVLSMTTLTFLVNALTAVLTFLSLIGYAVVYTVYLKRATPQNVVIGGAAGAMPPLVGWAAATGGLAVEALYPFGIVFLWTPPHFWALSLLIKDDYARTGVPMLPVVKGEAVTRRQILVYTLILVAFTLLPVATGFLGALYAAAAIVLGAGFTALAVALLRSPSRLRALRLYLSSLAYLALLFCAMAADRAI
jgi:heme o synthase